MRRSRISARAIELDPEFALAYDGLGACHVNRVFKGLGGAEDFEQAEAAFNRALAIDANIIEARMLMVFVLLWRGQKQKAREEVARMRRESAQRSGRAFREGDAAPARRRIRSRVAQLRSAGASGSGVICRGQL